MLIKHSFLYFLGRIIPGAVSLLTLALYTRFLRADQYGLYALAVAGISIINAVCFQWLSLSLGRYLPGHKGPPQELLSTTIFGFLLLVLATGVFGSIVAWLWYDKTQRWLIALVVVIAWAQAWFDLNLILFNARLSPIRYGLLSSIKALIAVIIGLILFYIGLGVFGILLGLMISMLISPILVHKQLQGFSIRNINPRLMKEYVGYGAPMIITFLSVLVLDVSDRFFLGWIMNAKAVGAYAAAYELAQKSLGVLMGIVHLAAFPLAVQMLEMKGEEEARTQISRNVLLLIIISLPSTIGFIILSGNIADVVLGAEFREDAWKIITIVTLSIFIGGIKSYYLDYSFQLSRKMRGQALGLFCASLANVVFNLCFIPIYGAIGAAFATLGGYIVGFITSWYLGQKVFILPPIPIEVYKVLFASIGMASILLLTFKWRGPLELLVQFTIGFTVYSTFLIILNVGGLRYKLLNTFL